MDASSSQYPVDTVAVREQYDTIWGRHASAVTAANPDAVITITRIAAGSATSAHVSADDYDAYERAVVDAARGGEGVYVVTGFMDAYTTKDGERVRRGRYDKGRKSDVLAVPCLDLDVDCREYPGHAAAPEQLPSESDLRDMLAELRERIGGSPTLSVRTGGGYHLRWALDAPADARSLETERVLQQWKSFWTEAYAKRGYKPDATPLTNTAGLLRVAGTWSYKMGATPRPHGEVTISKNRPEQVFSLAHLAATLPEPVAMKPRGGTVTGGTSQPGGAADDYYTVTAGTPLGDWALTEGALEALLECAGLEHVGGDLWAYPREDGEIAADPNVWVRQDEHQAGTVARVFGYGTRFNAPVEDGGWGVGYGNWSATDVLIARFCDGDAALAARIVSRLHDNVDAIVEALDEADGDAEALGARFCESPTGVLVRALSSDEQDDPSVYASWGDDDVPPPSDDDYARWAAAREADIDIPEDMEDTLDDGELVEALGRVVEAASGPTIDLSPLADPSDAAVQRVIKLRLNLTDAGFAERFALYTGEWWRTTVMGPKKTVVYHWVGTHWAIQHDDAAIRRGIVSVARHIATREAIAYGRDAAQEARAQAEVDRAKLTAAGDDKGAAKIDPDAAAKAAALKAAQALIAWAERYEGAHVQRGVIESIYALSGIKVDQDDWDPNLRLLATPRGVVDLGTGVVRAATPDLLQNAVTRDHYDPEARHDPKLQTVLDTLAQADVYAWETRREVAQADLTEAQEMLTVVQSEVTVVSADPTASQDDVEAAAKRLDEAKARVAAAKAELARAQAGPGPDDPDTVTFLGRFCGAMLTGYSPAAFLMLHGASGIGKSTLLEAFIVAMGDYGTVIEIETLEANSRRTGEGPRPVLDSLRGVRGVLVSEGSSRPLDGPLLKKITSGGLISSRGLYGTPQKWQSRLSLLICLNIFQPMDSSDAGLARRFYPVHFPKAITPVKCDPNLEAYLKNTAEGRRAVLSWAVWHAQQWLAASGGAKGTGADVAALAPPATVALERERYLTEADPLEKFWEACVRPADVSTPKHLTPSFDDLHTAYAQWATTHRVNSPVRMDDFERRVRANTSRFDKASYKQVRTPQTGQRAYRLTNLEVAYFSRITGRVTLDERETLA